MTISYTIKEDIIREQVIRTAQELFQRNGLDKVTMENVAEAVGKAKSSLYYYFKSKEEIWDAVLDVEISEILTKIDQAVEQANSVEEKIHAFCWTMLKVLRKKRALYHITYGPGEIVKRHKSTSAIRRRFVKQESVMLNQILTQGIDSGELRHLNQRDQDLLVFVLVSGLKGLEKEMVIEKDYNLESATYALSHMIINGLKA